MKWKAPKIWSGDCWVICGGSSISEQFNIPKTLIPETMEEFREYGDYLSSIHKYRCIGVNLAAFLGDWVDVAYWGDNDTYTEYKSKFDAYAGLKVSSAGPFSADIHTTIKYLQKNMSEGITKDRKQISWVSKNSGGSAINLAYHLGAQRIFLIGLDMYSSEDKRMHFHSGYPSKIKTPTLAQLKKGKKHPRNQYDEKKVLYMYRKQSVGWGRTAKDAEKLGIEIFNVNPKSAINAFKKVDLKEALRL